MRSRRLQPEEKLAWARVTKSVRPLPERRPRDDETDEGSTGHPVAQTTKHQPVADRAAERPSAGTMRPRPASQRPVNRVRERKVRRGQIEFAATLDLHGHTQASAARILPEFLARSRQTGARSVLVITGKGRLGEGILRRRFLHWLEEESARRLVSGYAPAHAKHGGSGAFYVFLRRITP